jgi:hypothetical protein
MDTSSHFIRSAAGFLGSKDQGRLPVGAGNRIIAFHMSLSFFGPFGTRSIASSWLQLPNVRGVVVRKIVRDFGKHGLRERDRFDLATVAPPRLAP